MTKVLSKFGKGVKGSVGLSFSLSGGKQCSDSCRVKGNGCYAENIEGIYKSYHLKLKRHQRIKPGNLVRAAIQEMVAMKNPPTWIRISVSGSLPYKSQLSKKDFAHFKDSLEDLCKYAKSINAKMHIPVETIGKARTYRAIFEKYGFTVRRTAQTQAYKHATDKIAYVAMKNEDWRQIISEQRAAGKKAFVCPAIVGKAKCGQTSCTLCSKEEVDLIVYPLHR